MKPSKFTCEELLPAFSINGHVHILDTGDIPSPNIIKIDDEWKVQVDFNIAGPLANCIDGHIKIEVLLEKMGIGEASLSGSTALVDLSGPGYYTHTLTFGANSVQPGVYRVIVVLTMISNNKKPCPLACFAKGPLLQFYDPS